jgi:hypothetical protein
VARPGGRIGLIAWTKTGSIDDLFRTMAPFQPPPPEGAGSPFAWGDADTVSSLLGDDFDLTFETRTNRLEQDSAEAYWQLMRAAYGPTKSLVESLSPERAEELHQAFLAHCERCEAPGDGYRQDREYLLVVGIRR